MISAAERRRAATRTLAALALALGLLSVACSRPPQAVELRGQTMGTVWTLRLAQAPGAVGVAQLRERIEAELETVNAEMSTYREDSVITRFNTAAAGKTLVLPEGFAAVLSTALTLAGETGGAYDPTVGPLVNLWGFGPEPTPLDLPGADAIAAARARVGHHRLDFDPATRALVQPGDAYLDLSSIAKGWAVDRVADALLAKGIADFVFDIGGDMRVHGGRADGTHWRIAIERPTPGGREPLQVIGARDVAIATSGTYRNWIQGVDGRRLSHTIDPRTGEPVTHHAVSITVVHPRCVDADALATALGVLPPGEAEAFATRRDLAVLWLIEEGGQLHERMTPAFQRFMESGGL